MVAHGQGLLLPKLRRQFAEFLQQSSLKRLGMLYLSTCVGLGYGLIRWCYFLERLGGLHNPISADNFYHSSHSTRLQNINCIPIDYAFRPRLRDRLTLR